MNKRFLLTALTLLVVVASVSSLVPPRIVVAATKPTAKWKVTALRPSTTVKTSSVLSTNSRGKQKWSAKGNCSLTGSRIKTRASGKCTLTVTISARSPYASRTLRKSFSIKTPTPSPETFDPYAGVAAATDAIGTRSERSLVTPDGRTRRYRIYVPSVIPNGTSVPLVVALHGGLGTSSQFEANSGLNGFAESNGFIVAYPDGVGNQPDGSGYQTWNGGYCCGPAATQSIDDITFIRNVVTDLRNSLPVNTSRVYALGHSNGGILSYKIACEMSDVVAAIGVQAGSNVVTDCRPAHAVSVFHLHGTSDSNMPINGGKGSGLSTTVFVSARSAVDAMATVNGCNVASPKSLVASNSDVTALSWTNCTSNSEVRFVTVKYATHAWMGHAAQSAGSASYVGDPYPNLDATRAILSFVLSKSR
jgi:polyhydroxybutyrate depolymerase